MLGKLNVFKKDESATKMTDVFSHRHYKMYLVCHFVINQSVPALLGSVLFNHRKNGNDESREEIRDHEHGRDTLRE